MDNLVGNNIRRLRIAQDMSQEILATKSGVFRTHLSKIETGRSNPSLSVLESIAFGLDVPVHALFTAPED